MEMTNLQRFLALVKILNFHKMKVMRITFRKIFLARILSLHEITNLKIGPSALGIIHTNIASLNAQHDGPGLVCSLLKYNFQIVEISEDKM